MKCTESEDEDPTKGSESQLQLSCFINQEVKYLATGLRLVSGTSRTQMSLQCSQSLLMFTRLSLHPEATGGHHEVLPILTKKCPLYQIGMFYLLAFLTFVASVEKCMNKINSHFLCFCIQVQNQPSPGIPHGSNGAVLLQGKRVCERQSPQGRSFTEEGFGISGAVTKISIH